MVAALRRALIHKLFWAVRAVKREGVLHFMALVRESLFLKRDFYILIYDINTNLKKIVFPDYWKIVHNDFELLSQCRETFPDLPIEFYFDRLDGSMEFYMVLVRNDQFYCPASICWLYTNEHINRVIKLKNNEVEIKHVATLTQFRNKGIFSKMLEWILIDLQTSGNKRAVSVIEINNVPSMKIFRRQGFSVVKKFRFCKILGFRISPLFSTDILED